MQKLSLFLVLLILSGCSAENREARIKNRALKIHEKIFTIDTHSDVPLRFTRSDFDLSEWHDQSESRSCLDFPRMKEGGLDAVFMAAFVGQGDRDEKANGEAKERVLMIMDSIHTHVEKFTDLAGMALSPDDAPALEKQGKRAVFIGIENGYPVGRDISNIREFYGKGARYITLCHTKNNDICDSSTDEEEWNGLSDFGREVVKEMNRLGMMVDISHVSDKSFFDVLEITSAPVIASHSCARAVNDSPRNLSDSMLVLLADNGGVIQVCMVSEYVRKGEPNPQRDSAFSKLREKYGDYGSMTDEQRQEARKEWSNLDKMFPRKLATVSDFVDHIDHIVDLIGVDHAGIGTDFDGGGGLADCLDVSQMPNITIELVKRGYSEEEIGKIWGGNLLRVFRKVQEEAKLLNR